MRWRRLAEFGDERCGKLWRLSLAAKRRFEVPVTWWTALPEPPHRRAGGRGAPTEAAPLEAGAPPRGLEPGSWIVRSAACDEDTGAATAAGKYESVIVHAFGEGTFAERFAQAVARVAASMRDARGGAAYVFLQPLANLELGGVAFFDGFFYERTEAAGGNQALTAGTARGDVTRADLVRGDPWSSWLARLGRAFAGELAASGALDIEYARSGERHLLLQVRPARFALRRNPILSLANHREILGAHPSPWVVDALVLAGRAATGEFAKIDPEVARFQGVYAEKVAGRAWLSFSFFFRLMDHWGLPRAMVTDGVGGTGQDSPLDGRFDLRRMLRKSPRLLRLQWGNRQTMKRIPEALARLDHAIDQARDLEDLFEATRVGLDVALRTNFAINGAWTGIARVRGALGIRGRARIVTERMRAEYEDLRDEPRPTRRQAFDGWIARYGHRGPLESDPMQPRFAELEDELWRDLEGAAAPGAQGRVGGIQAESPATRSGFWVRIEERRERFRDELMLRWQRLRAAIREAAARAVERGELDSIEDVWLLDGPSVAAPHGWRQHVAKARERRAVEARFSPPSTARREAIEAAFEARSGSDTRASTAAPNAHRRTGIGLGTGHTVGRVRVCHELVACLRWLGTPEGRAQAASTVLVVPALEPSWGLVFGRIGAVVTDLGGELSHASILLREAGVVAVVNCDGASDWLRDDDHVAVDAERGTVTLVRDGDPVPA